MNRILELKGKFGFAPNPSRPGPPSLPKGAVLHVSHLERLLQSLDSVRHYWRDDQTGFKPLVSVYYTRIIPKSSRMNTILKERAASTNSTIVGAKFSQENPPRHIFTHCVSPHTIENALLNLQQCKKILEDCFSSAITTEQLALLGTKFEKLERPAEIQWKKQIEAKIPGYGLSKSVFSQIIKDAYFIDHFGVEERTRQVSEGQIITLFDTGLTQSEILRRLHMQDVPVKTVDNVTWYVTPSQYNQIISMAPYLVSMAVSDLGRIGTFPLDGEVGGPNQCTIPSPGSEPVIGVIDTLFDESVYFAPWVTYSQMVAEELIEPEDYVHGTAVTSLIVDGPALNPHLDDGCGRFRVRHFGIAKHERNSTADIIQKIRRIVENNKDIKVWNLSLGSDLEIEQNFISPEAAMLDDIQSNNDIVFVVAESEPTLSTHRCAC